MKKKFVYQVGNNKKVILWCTGNQISTLYMFHTVSPSIIRSLKLYIYLMQYVQS